MANSQHAEDNSKHVKMPGEITTTCSTVTAPAAPASLLVASSSVPSFAAASELLSAPYSCLVMDTHRRHIALPPMYLNKKKTGIKEELDAELLRFSQNLNGVLLAYDNIRIVGHQGDIYDDSGYIHMNIEASFIVFKPTNGQKLLGRVNKLGVSHVGCLVHGCFNASMPKPNLVTMETWRDAGPQIGSELEFEVTALDADTAGVLLIRGRLTRTRVQELLAIGESTESIVQQPDEPDAEQIPETSEAPPEEPPKKKKKKKKDKEMSQEIKEEEHELPLKATFTPEQDTTMEMNGTMNETNGNVVKNKKKKKDKHIKEEAEEVELSTMEVHGSDSSGYLSDKPIKKRKHQSEITPGSTEECETPKSKKKRKTELKREIE